MNKTQRRLREHDELTMELLAISNDGTLKDSVRRIAKEAFDRIEELESAIDEEWGIGEEFTVRDGNLVLR